jgi:hypothetical protein
MKEIEINPNKFTFLRLTNNCKDMTAKGAHGIYLLGIFDGAKGKVGNHLLVCALIPLSNLNHSIQHEHLAVRRGLQENTKQRNRLSPTVSNGTRRIADGLGARKIIITITWKTMTFW